MRPKGGAPVLKDVANVDMSLRPFLTRVDLRSLAPSVRHRITKVACGDSHTLGLNVQGFVLSWGCGSHGQLGHGDTADVRV